MFKFNEEEFTSQLSSAVALRRVAYPNLGTSHGSFAGPADGVSSGRLRFGGGH